METLITITTGGQGSPVVSARELWSFLEAKQQFSDWIKKRIIRYGFLEDVDYVEIEGVTENPVKGGDEVIHKTMKNPKGGRTATDYALTLDMAKQLAMVERNEKGKQARLYFIEAEKALQKVMAAPTLLTNEQILIQLVSQQTQLMADTKQMLNQLRSDVDSIMHGHKPPKNSLRSGK
ncbi:hypothetical protein GO755_10560 [Spirosoma sp. HMF4905]|uniref:AntA/AntB antirepressor domain-containing protein n=1 Tax=Spirosoma arboris TaxID=2682092 RepID=A0A7K1SAB2_9BACT|nr:antA/AntB antirepressor family protein [Spirosoma arboris]MVM30476.1 hypothetical protein [Spirosoma arboris]